MPVIASVARGWVAAFTGLGVASADGVGFDMDEAGETSGEGLETGVAGGPGDGDGDGDDEAGASSGVGVGCGV